MIKTALFLFTISFLYILYSPFLLDFQPIPYSIDYLKFDGVLSMNRDLDFSELIAKGDVIAPECVIHKDGKIYASVLDGRIVILQKDKVVDTFVDIAKATNKPSRPLGMRIFENGLYVADALQGLLVVNMDTGAISTLLPINEPVDGVPLVFPDDLDIDEHGTIYMSEFTVNWRIHQVLYMMFEHSNDGRVITYDTKTGKAGVLLDKLFAPNGIQVSHDKKSLLITETTNRKIIRYHFQGPKKGNTDIFCQVPGEPDNIRPNSKGGYWVALPFSSNETRPHIMDTLASYPKIRKIIARVSHMAATGISFLNLCISNSLLQHYQDQLMSGHYLLDMYNTKHSIIMELDAQGNIIRSLQSDNPQFAYLTHPLELDGYLYMGTFVNDYIVKIKL